MSRGSFRVVLYRHAFALQYDLSHQCVRCCHCSSKKTQVMSCLEREGEDTTTTTQDDGGVLLERLALLMPMVNRAVANFSQARARSDDLAWQQQVCDTLVERATSLLRQRLQEQQEDEHMGNYAAALLVHVLLDKVLAKDAGEEEALADAGSGHKSADDSDVWAELLLPSLCVHISDMSASSSSASSSSSSSRSRMNPPPTDWSPLVPHMLELAWQKDNLVSSNEEQADNNNQQSAIIQAFPTLYFSSDDGEVDIFQDDNDDESSSALLQILPHLPASVSSTSLPTSTHDDDDGDDNDRHVITEVPNDNGVGVPSVASSSSSTLSTLQNSPYDPRRLRAELDALEAWVQQRVERNSNTVSSLSNSNSDNTYQQLSPTMRAELESMESWIFQQLLKQRTPRESKSLDEEDYFSKNQQPKQHGFNHGAHLDSGGVGESLPSNIDGSYLVDTSKGEHSMDTSISGSLTVESQAKVHETPLETSLARTRMLPFVSVPPSRRHWMQGATPVKTGKPMEADACLPGESPFLTSLPGESPSLKERRKEVTILFDESLFNQQSLGLIHVADASTESVAPSKSSVHRSVSVAIRSKEDDMMVTDSSKGTPGFSSFAMGNAPQNDEMFWTCRVRWTAAEEEQDTKRFRFLQPWGKWGRKNRSSIK